MLLNNGRVIEEIKNEVNIHRVEGKWKHNIPEPMEYNESSLKREVRSYHHPH